MKKAVVLFLATTVAMLSSAQAQAPAGAEGRAPSAPALQAPASDTHLAAVREMLDALRIVDMTLLGMQLGKPKDPGQAEFIAHFLKHMSKEELAARYASAYVRHVSAADARLLAAGFRTSAARKSMQYQIDLRTIGKDRMPPLSAADIKAMRAFDTSAASHKFADIQRLATEDASAALGRYVGEHHAKLFSSGVQEIASKNAERLQSDMQSEPVLFVPAKTGISYVDAVMRLVATSAFRNTHATWRVDQEIEALGVSSMMAAENLAAVEQLLKSRAALDRIEQKVEAFMTEIDANMNQFSEGFKAIEMPGKQEFQRGFQIGLERHVEWSVRFAENQRALIDVMRRVLAFSEARKGQMQISEGKILFRTDADVDLYNALVAEMQREAAKGEGIRSEAMGRIANLAKGKF